jgi:hypothetical protein
LKKKILLASAIVIKTYNIQLLKNLMHLGLHPPNVANYIHVKIFIMWTFVVTT